MRGENLNAHFVDRTTSGVTSWSAFLSGVALFVLSSCVLLGILQWLPHATIFQRDLLAAAGTVAIAGWSVLVFRLLKGWALSEQRSRTAFDQAMAGIGLIDGEARWIDVNERMSVLTGYSVDELRGKPLCMLLMPEDVELYRGKLLQFIGDEAGPAEYSIESRWRRKDGTAIWLSRHVRRVASVRGAPARAMMMVLDISDRKRAEIQAIEQRSLESFQFANSPMPLIEWGPEMRVRRWSKQSEALFGWTASEVTGRTLREAGILPQDEADHHEAVMRQLAVYSAEFGHAEGAVILPIDCNAGRHRTFERRVHLDSTLPTTRVVLEFPHDAAR